MEPASDNNKNTEKKPSGNNRELSSAFLFLFFLHADLRRDRDPLRSLTISAGRRGGGGRGGEPFSGRLAVFSLFSFRLGVEGPAGSQSSPIPLTGSNNNSSGKGAGVNVLLAKPPTNLDAPPEDRSNPKKKRRNRNKKKKAAATSTGANVKRTREELEGEDEKQSPDEEVTETKPKKTLTEAEQAYRAQVFTDVPFTDVEGLSDASLRAIKQFGFPTMTRIQALAIPAALKGRDVLIRAKTGHGKTLAFGVPLFECLLGTNNAQGLVVAPTRELALQTKQVFEKVRQAKEKGRVAFSFLTQFYSLLLSMDAA